MRIAIDLTPLYGRRRTGVEMYAIDLYRALCKTKHDIIPIFHQENELGNSSNAIVIPKCNRLLLETFKLATVIRKVKPDIALFPIFPPARSCYKSGVKIIPTLHDFAFIDYKQTLSWKARMYLTPRYMLMFKKAYGVITISETIKKKLENYTKRPVWNCGENISEEYRNIVKTDERLLKKWSLKPNQYIISVSTIEPRKNLKYLLNIIKNTPSYDNKIIVLVGRRGWGNDDQLKKLIEQLEDRIVFTGYVSIDELISLYHFSYSFALLSLDEGFGRTPFEAVACGCKRIILSDIPIFHETFDGNATFLPLNAANKASRILNSFNLEVVKEDFELPFDVVDKRVVALFDSLK